MLTRDIIYDSHFAIEKSPGIRDFRVRHLIGLIWNFLKCKFIKRNVIFAMRTQNYKEKIKKTYD